LNGKSEYLSTTPPHTSALYAHWTTNLVTKRSSKWEIPPFNAQVSRPRLRHDQGLGWRVLAFEARGPERIRRGGSPVRGFRRLRGLMKLSPYPVMRWLLGILWSRTITDWNGIPSSKQEIPSVSLRTFPLLLAMLVYWGR
jgi:hypothetical protein